MTTTRTSAARRPGGAAARTPAPRRGGWPVRDRSILRPVLGVPPVAAVGIAVGATAVGVLVDLLRIGTVGGVFEVAYLLGCVLAVGWVRRRAIFVTAVQPPLLLAVVVPLLAVAIGAPTGGGAAQSVLLAGAPLINAFPAMAVTTLVVLLVAAFRLVRQRLGPDDAVGRLRVRMGRDPGGHDPDGTGLAGPASAPRGGAGAIGRPAGEGRGRSDRPGTRDRDAARRATGGGSGGAPASAARSGSVRRSGGATGSARADRPGRLPGDGGRSGGGRSGGATGGTGRSGRRS